METKEELLRAAVEVLDLYLNAGDKEARTHAAEEAKKVYEQYYGRPYANKRDR